MEFAANPGHGTCVVLEFHFRRFVTVGLYTPFPGHDIVQNADKMWNLQMLAEGMLFKHKFRNGMDVG